MCKKEDFAYRVYDIEAITRLRQIIILRKLRIPLKQIAEILQRTEACVAIEVFENNLLEIEDEITALSTIRSVIKTFIEYLNFGNTKFALPDDEWLLEIVDSLTISKINFKEEKSIDQLNNASEKLNKIEDKDVRIIYLPPMTVAAAFASGEGCLDKASNILNKFIKESELLKMKPDARGFDFDYSRGTADHSENLHGHEAWVSVPENMEIPSPLVRREFRGGLYAAHVLRAWDFQDWRRLKEWLNASDKYDSDWGSPRWETSETGYGQGFVETLNLYNFMQKHNAEMSYLQLDLLVPIKEKEHE